MLIPIAKQISSAASGTIATSQATETTRYPSEITCLKSRHHIYVMSYFLKKTFKI